VALKKSFHKPDGPPYNVPRTGTLDESAETWLWCSSARLGEETTRVREEDVRAAARRREISPCLDVEVLGEREAEASEGPSRTGLEVVIGAFSRVPGSSSTDDGVG
jgi:hypothetical protein